MHVCVGVPCRRKKKRVYDDNMPYFNSLFSSQTITPKANTWVEQKNHIYIFDLCKSSFKFAIIFFLIFFFLIKQQHIYMI
jgi:hypothetical protein